VWALKAGLPGASLPELVFYDWLKAKGIPFIYQAAVFGGRAVKGGLVPDFIIDQGGYGIAVQVQGNYWHSLRINRGRDNSTRLRLLGAVFNGVKIREVVDLWESRAVSTQRETAFMYAVIGISLPP
jgi:hypothetical protein